MKKHLLVLIACFYVAFCHAKQKELSIFVAKEGSNTNSGSESAPVKTIDYAFKMISESNSSEIHLYIRQGNYECNESLVISGSNKNITISNYNNELVTISGGKKLDNSTLRKVTAPEILSRLNENAKNNIYQIDLKKAGITDYGSLEQHGHRTIKTAPLELFIDNRAFTLARWPNNDYLPIGKVIRNGLTNRKLKVEQNGAVFGYSSTRPQRWIANSDIWIGGFLANGFSNDNIKIKDLNAAGQQVSLQTTTNYGVLSTSEDNFKNAQPKNGVRRFYFYNILEELDFPGEYYVDRKSGILYFYSDIQPSTQNISVSLLKSPLLKLLNAKNILIKGIEFANGRDVGIYAENTSNIKITKCSFLNFGTIAISLGKVTNDKTFSKSYEELISNDKNSGFIISDCKILNAGTGGIFLTGGNRKQLESGLNVIKNCEIANFSRRNFVGCPAVFLGGVGAKLLNCSIHESEGQAIMYWGNDHEIAFNSISNVVKEINDQGAVYTGRDPSSTGTTIHDNLFFDITSKRGFSVAAVYIDDGSGGISVNRNIFRNCGSSGTIKFGAIHINGGGDNHFDNNFFIDCDRAVSRTIWSSEKWISILGTPEMKLKLQTYTDITSVKYQTKYPYLKKFAMPANLQPGANIFSNSLIINIDEFTSNSKAITQKNTVLAANDANFISLKSYRIGGSYKMWNGEKRGISSIDVSKIGIVK